MCLTVPGRIVQIDATDPAAPRAEVEFATARRAVSLAFTPEARVGDYVLVQSGFAIRCLEPSEAREALEYHRQLGDLAAAGETGARDAAART